MYRLLVQWLRQQMQLKKLASQDLPSAHVKHCCRPSLTSPPACDYFPQIFSPSCDKDKQETIFLGARWLTFLLYEKCGQASRFLFHVWSLNFLLSQVKDQRDPIPAANPTAPWRLKRCSEEQKKWWVWNSSFVTLDQVLESSLTPKFLYSLDFFRLDLYMLIIDL